MQTKQPFRRGYATLAWVLLPLALVAVGNAQRPLAVAADVPPIGWSQGASLPPEFVSRWDFAYAYFPPLDEVVLFGGSPKVEGEPWFNDTWIYRDGAWTAGPAAPAGLTPRGGSALAYDPAIRKIVLFGGIGDTWPALADTWLFDGTGWTQGPSAPSSLEGRSGAEMAYLPSLGKLVLFGGSGVHPHNDAWLFDGTQWAAGPATPPDVSPRVFFGMAYDRSAGKIFVAGGDGKPDSWYFDGLTWTSGPSLDPVGPRERVRIAYDPQLSSIILFSGLGPGIPTDNVWRLQGTTWTKILSDPVNDGWPAPRVDGAVLWHPAQDALMVFSGIAGGDLGTTGLTDTWFFRDVAPHLASLSLTPTAPFESQALNLTAGVVVDGYGPDTVEYEWYINGLEVPGATGPRLAPGPYQSGDEVHARARVTDELGLVGTWTISNSVTINNRPPSIGSVVLSPTVAYVTSTLTAAPKNVSDPDGDPVVVHYTWVVNGIEVADLDSPVLTSDRFGAGDVVSVRAVAEDDRGAFSNTVESNARTIKWNLTPKNSVKPGRSVGVAGGGYAASERVDFKLDSPTAPTLSSVTAGTAGTFSGASVPIPSPLPGGAHMLYGVGAVSGIPGRGPLTVIPSASINPTALAAGDQTFLYGVGFIPGETVSATFPLGPSWPQPADSSGSVYITVFSPELPWPGGVITASAPSGSSTAPYNVVARFILPTTWAPLAPAPVTLTGYGATETVNAKFDGVLSGQSFTTEGTGSLRTNIVLPSTFGRHDITMAGTTSKISKTIRVNLPPTMVIAPTSGPVGTVVTVDSGPGWIPGSRVKLIWKASTVLQTLTADSIGTVHTTFAVPQSTTGTFNVKLNSPDLDKTASTTFTVTTGAIQQATYGRRRLG